VDIAGATKKTYRVTSADEGAAITVVVMASKTDLPSASATSEAVTVKFASTTKLTLDRLLLFGNQRATATVTVDSASPQPPAGTVTVRVDSKSYEVPLSAGDDGRLTYKLPKLSWGLHLVTAEFGGSDAITGSKSSTRLVLVLF